MNRIHEEEHRAEWGGRYSVYTSSEHNATSASEPVRGALIHKAATANAITLEQATTAAYLAHEGEDDPWGETARRKPDKAEDGRLENVNSFIRSFGVLPVCRKFDHNRQREAKKFTGRRRLLPVFTVSPPSLRVAAAYIPMRRLAEHAFVLAVELGGAFIAHGQGRAGRVFLLRQHQAPRFVQTQLLVVL